MNINGSDVFFNTFSINQLNMLVNWYNSIEDSFYATGWKLPVSSSNVFKMLLNSKTSMNDFFVGIYYCGEFVGVLKACFFYKNKKCLWIKSLLIHPKYRSRGIGSRVIENLIRRVSKSFSNVMLSVIDSNKVGLAFWLKNDFKIVNSNKNVIDTKENIIILSRKI